MIFRGRRSPVRLPRKTVEPCHGAGGRHFENGADDIARAEFRCAVKISIGALDQRADGVSAFGWKESVGRQTKMRERYDIIFI